jgi:hypothetical protein
MNRPWLQRLFILFAISTSGLLWHGTGCADGDDAEWGRDPFSSGGDLTSTLSKDAGSISAESGRTSTADLLLQAILMDADGNFYAVADGHSYRRGDRFGNARILRVERFSVTLEEGGERRTIDLFGRKIKWGKP